MKEKIIAVLKFFFEAPEVFVKYYWYILLFGTKFFLIYYFSSSFKYDDYLWYPSFFFYEICMAVLLWGLSAIISKCNLNAVFQRIIVFCIYFVVVLITIIVYSLIFTSLYQIGFVINWYTSICNMVLLEDDGGLAWDSIPTFLTFTFMQIAIVLAGTLISCIVKRRSNYSEKIPESPTEDSLDLKIVSESPSFLYKFTLQRCKYFALLLITTYLVITFLFCPQNDYQSIITKGPLITLVNDVNSYFHLRCEQIRVDLDIGGTKTEWLGTCRTLNDAFIQFTSKKRTCFKHKKYITDFSFVKRNKTSQIQNVVVIYLESTRVDSNPFDYESRMSVVLNDEALISRNITPFMDNLVKKARYSTKARSVCSYTIKSMLAGLCSTYPFPKSYVTEHNYELPRKCITQLLKLYGNFSTAYIEPMNLFFDNHDKLFKNRVSFDYIFAGENITNGQAGNGYKKLGFMHYEDGALIKPLFNWVDNQTRQGDPFFLFYSTGTTHFKWDTPKSFQKRNYIRGVVDENINSYINSIRYIDDFLKEIFTGFEERGLTKNTLFILYGDHGVSLGEHHLWITTDIPYETQFTVPAIIYTENEEWLRRYPPGKIDTEWSNLDILPTILDALRINDQNSKLTGEYPYEGQSMIRENYTEKIAVGLANPGLSYITFKEGDKKVIFPEIPNKEEVYHDLSRDPYEEYKLYYRDINDEFQCWVGDMRMMRALYINKTTDWYINGIPPPTANYSIDYFDNLNNP